MPLVIINGPFIQAGQSLSDPIDCGGVPLVRITGPIHWTPADLTFQISTDGILYNDLYAPDGSEVKVTMLPGSKGYQLLAMPLIAFVKFRSGTSRKPIPQAELREFAVAVDQ